MEPIDLLFIQCLKEIREEKKEVCIIEVIKLVFLLSL